MSSNQKFSIMVPVAVGALLILTVFARRSTPSATATPPVRFEVNTKDLTRIEDLGPLQVRDANHVDLFEAGGDKSEKKVNCPVGKPDPIPKAVLKLFSTDAKVTLQEKKAELGKLDKVRTDEEVADALRWLIYQPSYSDEVRDLGTQALMEWRLDWLVTDLLGLLNDPAQSLSWRARCVKNLGILHSFTLDKEAYKGVLLASASKVPVLQNAAIMALARLCQAWNWHNTNPEKLKHFMGVLTKALASKNKDTLIHALKAVQVAVIEEKAADAERLASDLKQPVEVREAALYAMGTIPRFQSLPILDANLASKEARLLKAAKSIQPNVLTAQLNHADKAIKERAFNELTKLGDKAFQALQHEMRQSESPRRAIAKTILGQSIVETYRMKLLDRTGLKVFGAEEGKPDSGVKAILMDPKTKRISIEGEFCLELGPLEYAVVCKGENAKLHESGIALHCSPLDICYALLACNYTFAGELRANGKINLPKGAGVMISVEYEREVHLPSGKKTSTLRLPLESFIWNAAYSRPMTRVPWAFTGSRMQKMPDGKQVMMAMIEKSVVAIKSDPNALLNTPLDTAELSDTNPEKGGFYEINSALVPKRGSKCFMIFEPWTGEQKGEDFFSDKGKKKAPAPKE